MAFNGSGTFNRLYNWVNDKNNSIPITASRMDDEMNGMAVALSNCITRDGQSVPLANLPMNGFRFLNVGDAQTATEFASLGQLNARAANAGVWGGTSTGTATAYIVAPTTPLTAIAAGNTVDFMPHVTGTGGATTLVVSALAAITIKKRIGNGLVDLADSDLPLGCIVTVKYDGTYFQLINVKPYIAAASIASAATLDLTAATGDYAVITGTTGITAITMVNGDSKTLYFSSALTITNGASLVCPYAANLSIAAGDVVTLRRDGTVTRVTGVLQLTPTVPTAIAGTSTTQAASTAFVAAAIAAAGSNHGQCYLAYVSSTQLKLSPKNGNSLKIAGASYGIPAVGVTLANTALVAATLYYIYAYMSSGTMTLEASTTAYTVDTTAGNIGVEVKTGDNTRTHVGMAYMGAGSPGIFQAGLLVMSRFNKVMKEGKTTFTTNRTTTSATYAELNSEIRNSFIIYSGDPMEFTTSGTGYNSSGVTNVLAGLGIDSTTVNQDAQSTQTTPAGGAPGDIGFNGMAIGLSEGLHYATLLGKVNGGTGTFISADAGTTAKCVISIRIAG